MGPADYVLPIGGARDLTGALQGQFFTALSPTPGTGIIGHAAPTTFDATKPYLLVYNPASSKRLMLPMFLRLTLTVASVGNSVMRFTQVIDPGDGSTTGLSRYSSGGSTLISNDTNMNARTSVKASVYAGAVVARAANAGAVTIANTTFRTVIGVVGDVYQLTWACPIMGDPASLITTGTALANVSMGYAPTAIGPGGSFLVHQWAASQSTGPTFEVEFGFLEIPI